MTFTTATVSRAARSRAPPPASSAARRAASSIRTSGSRPAAGSAGRSIVWPAPTSTGRIRSGMRVPRVLRVASQAMLRTPICDLFGIEYPILLAGMGGVSMAPLVAAVSNAGGLGVMGAAALSPDDLRAEIRKTKALTRKPFAVDLLAPLPHMIVPYLPILYEEEVRIFVAGLAVPEQHVAAMKAHGMKIMVMTGKVKHAVRAERAGADVVAAQGTEAGGHTGDIGTLALVPQVVDAVKIPVVAARGIATPEATAARQYREALVRAEQDETIRTRAYSGKPLRALKNPYIAELESDPARMRPFPEQLMISSQRNVMAYWNPEVDPERTCFPAGQGVGAFREVKPAGEVLREIVAQAEAILRRGLVAEAAPR